MRSKSLCSDTISIHELRLEAIIGLFPWERIVKQTILVDIDAVVDFQSAVEADDFTKTVDYAAICQAIKNIIEQSQFNLIETLAHKISLEILEQFHVDRVRVSVKKLDVIANVESVGVTIERHAK